MLACDACAFFDRLDGANFIVGVHDADDDRARSDRPAQVIGIDAPESIYRQVSCPGAEAFKKSAWLNDRRVFDPGGDDVIAPVALCKVHAF
jgi:hypothetical protein